MIGVAGVMAIVLAETVAGATLFLWVSPLWTEVKRGFFKLLGGILTVLGPEEHRRGGDLLRSAGRPAPGNVVGVLDEDGSPVATGETGEVCAKAGNFMRGYWNREEETATAFRGGWYHTGDAGYLDENGYLFLVDRVKDMIVTGGENVYSAEVENAVAQHPAVAACAVIGVPDDEWGERVHAVVVLKPGAAASEDSSAAETGT